MVCGWPSSSRMKSSLVRSRTICPCFVADGGEEVDYFERRRKRWCWLAGRAADALPGNRANTDSRSRREIFASNSILLQRDAWAKAVGYLFARPHTVFSFPPFAAAGALEGRNSAMAFHLHGSQRQVSAMYATPKRSALVSGFTARRRDCRRAEHNRREEPIRNLEAGGLGGADIGRYLASVPREKEGGGGGGTRSDTAASLGRLPERPAASSPRLWPSTRT